MTCHTCLARELGEKIPQGMGGEMSFMAERGNSPLFLKSFSKPGKEASELLRRLPLGPASVDKHTSLIPWVL